MGRPAGTLAVPWMRINSSTRSMGRVTSERKDGTRTEKPVDVGETVKPKRWNAWVTSASAMAVPNLAAT